MMKPKSELIRVVKNKNNEISKDTTFKMPGRGAYVCNNLECIQKTTKTKGFDRSLKRKIAVEIYESLLEERINEQNISTS